MHEVGSIVEGKVTGLIKFGAFVELDDGTVGMVHISEVSQTYVNDISEHLKENQEVKVKILSIDDNKKVSLSIKKALPQQPRNFNKDNQNNRNNNGDNRDNRNFRNNRDNNNNNNKDNRNNNNRNNYNNRNNNRFDKGDDKDDRDNNSNNKVKKNTGNNNRNNNNNMNMNNFNRNATTPKGPQNFEDMLSKFMSSSEDKMSDIKKPSSNRRGGHSSKRNRDYD